MLIMPNNADHTTYHFNKRKRSVSSSVPLNIDHLPFKKKKNKTAKDKQWWTKSEDARLRKAVETCGAKNWKLISDMASVGKSDVQCLQRWTQVLRPGLKKGTWSKDEDKRLTDLVLRISGGPGKQIPWKKIEREMGGRTAKQCRERWKLSLDPTINKTVWSKEEDEQLLKLQAKLGNSWSKIKDLLGTNRTENAVKLRYKGLKKREDKYRRNLTNLKQPESPKPIPQVTKTNSWGNYGFSLNQPNISQVKKENLDLTIPLPPTSDFTSVAWMEPTFDMFEVKDDRKYPSLNLERFESLKPTEFDEVLQMLSGDEASETGSV